MKKNLKILCILFSFILLVSFTNAAPALASSVNSSEEVVNIPDENLRKILINKLGKNDSDDITKSDLESLTILECTRSDIHSLEGLNYCKNLKYFTLGDSHVTDFSPISKLDKLGTINLNRDSLDDLSVLTKLADLKSLYSLSLYSNNISDLKPLAKFAPKLQYLSLGRNNISDLSTLSQFKNLESLNLEGNEKMNNFSALSGLDNLSGLTLSESNISDLSTLTGLKNLTYLNIDNNNISDLSPVSNLSNLQSLSAEHNKISNPAPVTKLTHLSNLNLKSNNIIDISSLANLKLDPNSTRFVKNVDLRVQSYTITAHPKFLKTSVENPVKSVDGLPVKNITDITGKGYYNSESNCITWKTIYTLRPQSYKFCKRNVDFGEYKDTIYSGTVYVKFK